MSDTPRLVEVEWLDSIGSPRWEDEEDILRSMPAENLRHRSVGWVLRDDGDGLLISASRSDNSDARADCTLIPRPAIVDVFDLERQWR